MAAPESASSAWRSRGKRPFFVEEPRLARHADQSARRVEDGHEQEREHDGDEPELKASERSILRKVGASEGGGGEDPVPGLKPSATAATVTASTPMMMAPGILRTASPAISRKPAAASQSLRLRQIAERDEGGRIVGDDAGILKRDQREEEPDAGGDAELQVHRDGIDQPGAQRRERQSEEQHAGDEHESERELPIAAEAPARR